MTENPQDRAQNIVFRPLPDPKTMMRGLQRMAAEQPPCGRPVTARQRYYTFPAIRRDYPDQFPDKFKHEDTVSPPAVNKPRTVKTVVESSKPKQTVIGVQL